MHVIRSLGMSAVVLVLVTSTSISEAQVYPNLKDRVSRRVFYELVRLPYYGVFDQLGFKMDDGTVTLSGQVRRPTLKQDAERVVQRVQGVERVVNEIEVLPVSPGDDRIRLATYRAIYGHDTLQRYANQVDPPIHIIVKNGRVRLVGLVASQMDQTVALMQARSVPGVFEVTNELEVEDREER